jgi:hypothetical protein
MSSSESSRGWCSIQATGKDLCLMQCAVSCFRDVDSTIFLLVPSFYFSSLLYSALDCVTYDNRGFRVFSCPRSCRHRITLLFLLHQSSPHLLRPIHLKTCHYKIPISSSHPPLLSSTTRCSSSWMPRPFFEFSLGSHVRTPGSALATAPPTIECRVDNVFPTRVGFVVKGGRVGVLR